MIRQVSKGTAARNSTYISITLDVATRNLLVGIAIIALLKRVDPLHHTELNGRTLLVSEAGLLVVLS
jgi:hypothetical protein